MRMRITKVLVVIVQQAKEGNATRDHEDVDRGADKVDAEWYGTSLVGSREFDTTNEPDDGLSEKFVDELIKQVDKDLEDV